MCCELFTLFNSREDIIPFRGALSKKGTFKIGNHNQAQPCYQIHERKRKEKEVKRDTDLNFRGKYIRRNKLVKKVC